MKSPILPDKDVFIQKVAETIREHEMLRDRDAVLVGLSGGPDSVALARVLLDLQPEFRLRLGLAHLNHMLRGDESVRDENFTIEFSKKCSLPLFTKTLDIGSMAAESKISLEEAGRKARYSFFRQTAQTHGFSRIALGHNRDDNAEQVLLSLVRGTGPGGLKGILPKRDSLFIRPLIRMAKSEILDFLDRSNQDFMVDSSNEDPSFLRNRVRHVLIPFLEESFNPKIRGSLDRLSRILQEEEDFFRDLVTEGLRTCLKEEKSGSVSLSLPELSRLHPALASRVLRAAISRVKENLKKISMAHIREIRDFMARAEPGKHLDLPGRIRIYKTRDRLTVRKEDISLRDLGRREKLQTRLSKGKKGPKA
ncbi:tRNA lysidine(34) synthetase TilS [Desulfospira joergensenii]|uniref:tRNA lysidine(34) synthetase TilS n=1 Tax=Desulfospira joergensenii TaxID=53329 RepID=UPI0003B7A13C|nr:tRNA lysidine(34) synthetase TilS [Desulfospira joergensenii]